MVLWVFSLHLYCINLLLVFLPRLRRKKIHWGKKKKKDSVNSAFSKKFYSLSHSLMRQTPLRSSADEWNIITMCCHRYPPTTPPSSNHWFFPLYLSKDPSPVFAPDSLETACHLVCQHCRRWRVTNWDWHTHSLSYSVWLSLCFF